MLTFHPVRGEPRGLSGVESADAVGVLMGVC